MDLPDDEKTALRVYLQRMEVRMSTQHRIATAFIGGAGLLLLIPIFFRDVMDSILAVYIRTLANQFPQHGTIGLILSMVLYGAILYPFFLSLAIPLYGVYLLLKDIVHFYFTVYMPGFPSDLLNPTFAMWAGAFSPDESPQAKAAIKAYQYNANHMPFMMPFSEGKRELYFDTLYEQTEGKIIPSTRKEEGAHDKSIRHFNTAFGLARGLDRSLIEEAALTEMMLVRNTIYLRRLMLRYVKTLLMFIWTTMLLFLMLPLLNDKRFPTLIILGAGYLVWSLGVLPVMKTPLHWIYRHRSKEKSDRHVDAQLTLMESVLERFAYASLVTSFVGLVLAIAAFVQA